MRRIARAAAVALTFMALASRGLAEDGAPLSANLRAGGIDSVQLAQPRSEIRAGRATGVVDAPVDSVMRVVLDYGNYRRFLPNFLASRVLSRRGAEALIYLQVSALEGLTALWAEMRVRAVESPEPTRVVIARMIKGNLKQFEATWFVRPLSATQTLVRFELHADPDFPLPFANGIVSEYNEKEARHSIDGLRRYLAVEASPEKPSATAAPGPRL